MPNAKSTAPSSGWSFLWFASEDRFLGGAIVAANGIGAALQRATKLGINPGGEVTCWPIQQKHLKDIPVDMQERLLTESEILRKLGGTVIGQR